MAQQKKTKRQKTDWRRLLVAALALIMVLAMVLPLVASLFTSASAVTQADLKNQISGLKTDATDAASKTKELEQQLKAIQNDKAKALEQWQLMGQQLDALDAQIDNTQSQIDTYEALIQVQEEALAEAQDKEEAAYQRFCQRARSMEEAGSISYWSVLFAANSFSDLLDRLALVDEIMAYDNKVVDELVAAREAEEVILADLNETKAGLDERKAALDEQRAVQSDKVDEAQALLDELKSQEQYAKELEKAAEEEEERIRQEIQKKEKELEELIALANANTGSGYIYPLPSQYTTVSSRFGYRICPFHGPENHSGVDLPAPGGTQVKAVQGGVVVASAYAPSGYGEYIAINHGNGIVTLYAHMTRNSRKVKVGDVVKQGQVIGLVGSTGSSTGNHLHLELQVNGVRQDALTLFPAMTFTFRD